MSEPPPAPQISPDGKFYWDGQAWQPMPTSGPAPAPPLGSIGYHARATPWELRPAAVIKPRSVQALH